MWHLIRRSTEFVLPDLRPILRMMALALVVAALGAAEPLVTKLIFDELSGEGSLRMLALGVVLLCVVAVTSAVLSGWMSVILWNARIRVDYRLRERLVGKLYRLPVAFHREQRVGGLVSKLNQSVTGFLNAYNEVASGTLPSLLYLTLSIVAMLSLDWRLSVLVFLFLPVPTLVGAWAAREQAGRERLLMEKWSDLYARLHETLAGILTVKGFVREQGELGHFLATTAQGNRIVQAGIRRDTVTTGIRNFAATLARLAAIGVGGYLVARDEITVGTLVAFLGYIGGLFGPVQGLTGTYQTVRRGMVGLETIYGILDAEDEQATAVPQREARRLAGAVSFRNVSFTYPASGTPVLRDIDLEVMPGETVALVGPSGSGKTTIVNLLQRQYDVSRGRLVLDGTDIRELSRESVRRQLGIVYQDVHLFNDTVRANIAYGRPEASLQEIEAAARAAHAHEFIRALPEGYDTVLGERGGRLSGGQRQRLAIARALLVDPPLLILDEATSALDAESEAAVQAALRNLKRGRTTFVIAHRLATVTEADRIVVLRSGRIEEVGSHDELMRRGGYYAELVRLQADGMLPSSSPMPVAVAA